MPTLETNGISLFYETYGDRKNPPVMLITGLGGAGASWGPQIKRFTERYFVILPDHRGAGRSSRPADGYTIANHAIDMAALIDHLGVGPAHVVGSSTGGCIAMAMCLDHAAAVKSAVVVSSFARMDAYMIRQFELRKKLIAQFSARDAQDASALFLFSPQFAGAHADVVAEWVDRVASLPLDRAIAVKRIDMIMAFDEAERLSHVERPTLIVCGDQDLCTPLNLSEELAQAIPGAKLAVVKGAGHFVYLECEQEFFDICRGFVDGH
ncbi:MAG TPA: alpha/beta fold hydrolase [Pseudolabrys sp.]|nr:alpha/beta fold hydrolase [Pseudolabrys sp.]